MIHGKFSVKNYKKRKDSWIYRINATEKLSNQAGSRNFSAHNPSMSRTKENWHVKHIKKLYIVNL